LVFLLLLLLYYYYIIIIIIIILGRDSLVDLATRYGLDDPGVEEIFRTPSRRARDPSSLLYNEHRGVKRSGRGVDHPPTLTAAEVKERV